MLDIRGLKKYQVNLSITRFLKLRKSSVGIATVYTKRSGLSCHSWRNQKPLMKLVFQLIYQRGSDFKIDSCKTSNT